LSYMFFVCGKYFALHHDIITFDECVRFETFRPSVLAVQREKTDTKFTV
jgi:hypothetical protein